jgi:hypothetical protein
MKEPIGDELLRVEWTDEMGEQLELRWGEDPRGDPVVLIMRGSKGVAAMTPSQSRKLAAQLIAAATCAERRQRHGAN